MGTHLSNSVFHALTGMFSVTVEDICSDMPMGKHTLRALEFAYHIPPTTEINRAIRWMDRLILSQKAHRQARNVYYDSNMLIGLVQHKRALEEALERREPV